MVFGIYLETDVVHPEAFRGDASRPAPDKRIKYYTPPLEFRISVSIISIGFIVGCP